MEFKLLTLRWSPTLHAVDESPLLALAAAHDILTIREHLVLVHDVPHLVCLVSCQPRAAPIAPAATDSSPAPAAAPRAPAISTPTPTPTPTRAATAPPAPLHPSEQLTYDAIRRWRAEQAHHDGVPRYVILTNRNIDALVRERPPSLAALARIPGIGPAKVERHGQALLALLHPQPTLAPRPDSASATSHEDPREHEAPPEDPAA